jgi:Leucine-rich repeat (LRR) protein
MKRNNLNLRAMVTIVACLAATSLFWSCNKNDDEDTPVVKGQMTMTTQQDNVRLRIIGSGTMTINWGDGTSTTYTLSPDDWCFYNYSGSSAHTITITGENITHLYSVEDNRLTSLNVSGCTALTELWCSGNHLTALDVSNNTALTYLACAKNHLTALNVSKNTALTALHCDLNQLTALNVSNNTALTVLNCSNNQLTSLDVSKNTALTSLFCRRNQLTTLDVSKNTALKELRCDYNQLTTLDVSKNTALQQLDCKGNQLTDTALNNLFGTLHSNTIEYGKWIDIRGNPGTATCDKSIAENKEWGVRI